MRLTKLDVRGFGRLKGAFPLEMGPGTVALLLERNEAGKTTLSAAVLAALFGLPGDRRRSKGKLTQRDHYRPWGGGDYGVSLHLTVGNQDLVIDRDFEADSVRVLAGGKDVSDRFQQGSRMAVGEMLTGLSREQFMLSAFMGQGDLIWSDGSGLSDALQRVADSRSGSHTAASALAVLEGALTNYEGVTVKNRGRVDTEVKRCQDRIAEDQRNLEALDARRNSLREAIDGLGQRHLEQRQLEAQRKLLRYRRLRTEQGEVRARLENDDLARARLDEYQQQLLGQEELLEFTRERLHQVEAARRVHDSDQRLVDAAEEQRLAAESQRATAQELLDEAGLSRAVTDADRDVIKDALLRMEFVGNQRRDLELQLQQESKQFSSEGLTLDQAVELASGFHRIQPADRDVLRGHAQALLGLVDERQRKDEVVSHTKRSRAELRQGQQLRKHFGIWCLIVGMLPIMAGISMHAHLRFDPLWLYVPGLLFLVTGIVAFSSGSRYGRRQDAQLKQTIASAREDLARIELDEEAENARWNDLAQRLGLEPTQLERRYERYLAIERQVDTVGRLRDRLAECDRLESESVAGLSAVENLFARRVSVQELPSLLESVEAAAALQRELDAARTTALECERRLNESKAHVREDTTRVVDLLGACGIEMGSSMDKAFEALHAKAEVAQKTRHLRDVTVPDLEQQLLDSAATTECEERLSELAQEMSRLRTEFTELGEAPEETELQPLSQRDYDDAMVDVNAQDQISRERNESERTEARAFLAHYEEQAPRLRESLDLHTEALRQAQEFQESVTLARDTLAAISRETHRDWATAINRHANEILGEMGSHVRELHLDENLHLRMKHGKQLLTGSEAAQQLSAGAIDGVYLAVRMAIARFLSGGSEVLPLILDDPFANADDQRLEAGLELLLESVARDQQVLLMACQHSRYAWARAQLGYPENLVLLPVDDPTAIEDEAKAAAIRQVSSRDEHR